MKSNVNDRCKLIMLTNGNDVNRIENRHDGDNDSVNFNLLFGSDKSDYVSLIDWINVRIAGIARELVYMVGNGFGVNRGKVGETYYISHIQFFPKRNLLCN